MSESLERDGKDDDDAEEKGHLTLAILPASLTKCVRKVKLGNLSGEVNRA